jgi:hypothetical protein
LLQAGDSDLTITIVLDIRNRTGGSVSLGYDMDHAGLNIGSDACNKTLSTQIGPEPAATAPKPRKTAKATADCRLWIPFPSGLQVALPMKLPAA